jgi:hypothetical protein
MQTPFREMYTLSDAVELVGRHLYSHTWTGREYFFTLPVDSPQEIVAKREPLEKQRDAAIAEFREIEKAILATTNAEEISHLMVRRESAESRSQILNTQIVLDHPMNEGVVETYESHVRHKCATETLIDSIRQSRLNVHDGRGRFLSPWVWTDSRFRCDIELSIVINPKTAGGIRRQAARIDREPFDVWLKTIPRLVERIAPDRPEISVAPEKQCESAITNWVESRRIPINRTAASLELKRHIPDLSERAFLRAWAKCAPDSWKKSGRRAKK